MAIEGLRISGGIVTIEIEIEIEIETEIETETGLMTAGEAREAREVRGGQETCSNVLRGLMRGRNRRREVIKPHPPCLAHRFVTCVTLSFGESPHSPRLREASTRA